MRSNSSLGHVISLAEEGAFGFSSSFPPTQNRQSDDEMIPLHLHDCGGFIILFNDGF